MKNKMQKCCSILLALLFVFGAFSVSASAEGETSGKAGENVTWAFDASSGTLSIGGSGDMDDYYYDESSGSIPSPWFNYSFQIKTIEIADGVTRIGDYAFYLCYYLKQIRIPESVISIGTSAFDGTGLYYNNSCWQNGLFILDNCVVGTDYMSMEPTGDFSFPEGVRLIADSGLLFKSFGTLTLPASLRYIGVGALSNCTMDKIVVDAQNPYLSAEGAILYNKDKTELVAYLDNDRDPLYTDKAPFVYEVPAGVTRIGKGAFLFCENFTGVVLPAGLKAIDYAAFQGCNAIASIVFPEGLTTIGPWAFNACHGLKTVELPESLQTIGLKAFYRCKGLESVTFKGADTQIDPYCFAEDPALKTAELPQKAESIPDYIFQGCTAIQSVVIPGRVKTIGFGAFSYCSALESVTIPRSVEKINAGAFYDTALKTVEYTGTQIQWDALKANISNSNEPLLNAEVSVIPPLTLDAQTVTLIYRDTKTLTASRETVAWSSSNEKVIKVDTSGNLTTVGKGTATVTATDPETGEFAACEVTVKYSFVQILIRIFLFGWIWY